MSLAENMAIMTKLKEYLEKIAAQKTMYEECPDPMDPPDFGGNQDDAFYAGQEDGEIILARALLKRFFDESY